MVKIFVLVMGAAVACIAMYYGSEKLFRKFYNRIKRPDDDTD